MQPWRAAPLILLFAIPAHGQTISRQSSAPAFAVATFKPSKLDGQPVLRPMRDGYRGTNLTLHMLIASAYENSRVESEPAWANIDHYDFEARLEAPFAGASNVSLPDVQVHTLNVALQRLLRERCGLAIYKKATTIPAYALVVAANGLRLKPDKPNDPDLPNGTLRLLRGEITGQGVPVHRLADLLSSQLGRPVLDETQLMETYDFRLQWQIDTESSDQPSIVPSSPPTADDPRAGIPAALEKQLGLKLVPAKTTVEVIVVDHLDRPSAN